MVTRGDDFDDFVRGSSTRLLRTAVLLTGDRAAAEDLVQEMYERVYVRWRRIHSAPEAYARKTLANLAANRWRSKGRKPEVALADRHDPATPDGTEGYAVRDQLLTALQELPPRQRAVVVLLGTDEDLTEAQTAEALGCSLGTVKSQTSRALDRLRLITEPAFLEGLR